MQLHPQEPTRLRLAQLPTPIVEAQRIADQIAVERLLIKRDDLTGFEASGNKIRKLEYVLAEALNRGADTLVTHGGVQSNHCRATAAIGARLGLRVRLILRSASLPSPSVGNHFLDQLFGADISYHDPDAYRSDLDSIVESACETERIAGRSPFFIPVGASTPLGCWGYVRCLAELAEELGGDLPVDVYCATSSGGTQVGLMLGRALMKLDHWRIVGIPVSDDLEFFHRELRKLERATVEAYALDVHEEETPIHLIDGFIGEGYAIPYEAAVNVIRDVAMKEGLILDPSYTSKAMTGLLSTLRAGEFRSGATPVFLHSGGGFGLMARKDLFT